MPHHGGDKLGKVNTEANLHHQIHHTGHEQRADDFANDLEKEPNAAQHRSGTAGAHGAAVNLRERREETLGVIRRVRGNLAQKMEHNAAETSTPPPFYQDLFCLNVVQTVGGCSPSFCHLAKKSAMFYHK